MNLNDILEAFKKFGWFMTDYDWDCGYLVLAGIMGQTYCDETLEENDYGIIYFSRDYIGGEWDYNKWSVRFIACDSLSEPEISNVEKLINYLNTSREKYPDTDQVTNELVTRRSKMDVRVLVGGPINEENTVWNNIWNH